MARKKKVVDENKIILYDKVIRKEFILRNLEFFNKENTVMVNEFGITKKRVADIFHFDFNTNISTIFEIKGERDDICKRLEGQLNVYTSYANIVYVVTSENHLTKIEELLARKIYGKNVGIIKVDITGEMFIPQMVYEGKEVQSRLQMLKESFKK